MEPLEIVVAYVVFIGRSLSHFSIPMVMPKTHNPRKLAPTNLHVNDSKKHIMSYNLIIKGTEMYSKRTLDELNFSYN